jgi:2,3-dihydroxy-p-cumate/2,3-dihydroxybenzoate 3,4-dioxygenase
MIRYRRLGYVALNVTDLERSHDFYHKVLGLEPAGGTGPDQRFLRCSDWHHDVVLCRAERPGLKRVGLELESDAALAALRASLDAAGVAHAPIPAAEADAMQISPGLRFVDPVAGATFDCYLAMQKAQAPYEPSLTRIQRLGHVVIRAPDYEAAIRFFTDVLNFKCSDDIHGAVTFLRCFPNPLHHSLAITNGRGRSGLHHVNFMVSDMDDIGRANWRLQRAGIPIVNGPGRHTPSDSIFLYFLDPDGLTLEYSFGMEEFGEADPRPPRALPMAPESFDMWGAPTDPRKSAVGDIETASGRMAAKA